MISRRRPRFKRYSRPYYGRNYQRKNLTGGTGDICPQWFRVVATQSAADTCTETSFVIPITRIPSSSKVTIMEVLKIFLNPKQNFILPVTTSYVSAGIFTSTVGDTQAYADNPSCLAMLHAEHTTGGSSPNSVEVDLTDGAGHGVLVGTNTLYVQIASNGTSATNSMCISILYRFKSVGLKEYTGIVQSQN